MVTRKSHLMICPECGSGLWRVHRHLGDRVASLFRNVHRYRCRNIDCGWEGTRLRPARTGSAACRATARRGWAAAGLLVALVGALSLRFVGGDPPVPQPPVCDVSRALRFVPAGESYDGFDLPESRFEAPAPGLTVRSGCAWGVPGRSPYKGSVREALIAAQLPGDVVQKVNDLVEQGKTSGRLEISRDHIRTTDRKRDFDTRIVAMGFGRTMCFGTQVNFAPGHLEYADLYDATDASGKRFAVMVPYVCGNVSVLAERAERPEPAADAVGPLAGSRPRGPTPGGRSAAGARASRFAAGQSPGGPPGVSGGNGGVWVGPERPGGNGGGGGGGGSGGGGNGGGEGGGGGSCEPGDSGGAQTVPEPATLAIVLAALSMMVLGRRFSDRSARRQGGRS